MRYHYTFFILWSILTFAAVSNASLANFTIDDAIGEEEGSGKVSYDQTWFSNFDCDGSASQMPDACGLSFDTTVAGSGTWHASVSPGSMSLTFNGSAVYAYFIVPSVLFLDKKLDPSQVGSNISFILDGVQVQTFERVNALGSVEYNVPAYVNASLSAGLHNLTIQNHGAAGSSVLPAAVFDYAVYSSEESRAPGRDINVGALIAGLLGGILFVGLGLTSFAFLRIRARRYANAARIDALEAQLPITLYKEASSSHLWSNPERRVDEVKQTVMDPREFVGTRLGTDAPFPPNFRYSFCVPGVSGQRDDMSRLETNGMHICKSPQSGVDVILLRNSLASQGPGFSRRRSTLSRLGIRLGGDGNEGRLGALAAERSTVEVAGPTVRRRTVSRANAGGGEESEPSTISRDDTVLLLRLQAEIELLRAERERTRRLYPFENLPAYSELDTSDASSGVQ